MEKEEEEQELLDALSGWLFPSERRHLDAPRASLKVRGQALESLQNPGTYDLSVDLFVVRPRSGEKQRSLLEVVEIVQRSSHEEELFTPETKRISLQKMILMMRIAMKIFHPMPILKPALMMRITTTKKRKRKSSLQFACLDPNC